MVLKCWLAFSRIPFETQWVASACRCVCRQDFYFDCDFSQYFLGLLSGFQRANCFTSFCISATSALRSSFLHLLSPTLQLLFYCSATSILFCSRAFLRGEGGSFYICCLKFVKVFVLATFASPMWSGWRETLHSEADFPALERFRRFARFRVRVNADQVITHLFSCVRRSNFSTLTSFCERLGHPLTARPPGPAVQRGGAAYT